MQRDTAIQQSPSSSSSSSNNAFRVPRTKAINRPGTWFGASGKTSNQASATGSTSNPSLGSPSPFVLGSTFRSPFPSSKGKHKLSPSPSPRHYNDDDFVMISPIRPPPFPSTATMARDESRGASSSPPEDSPTPACGVASATARLKLVDDDSPIRRVPGQSRSLARGDRGDDEGRSIFLSTEKQRGYPTSPLKYSTTNLFPLVDDGEGDDGSPQLPPTPLLGSGPPLPPPQPLFPPLRTSQSQDCEASSSKSLFNTAPARKVDESRIPRLSTSHPLRARAATDLERPTLGGKKAVSLDAIPTTTDKDEPFGIPVSTLGKKSRAASANGFTSLHATGRAHKRINSGEQHHLLSSTSISRSFGQKSGLALSLTPSPGLGTLPDFASNSSLSSLSTNHMTPPTSAFSPAEPPIFEDVKPLAEAFAPANGTVSRKFKPRDSGVSMGDEEKPPRALVPPPSTMKPAAGRPRRPAMLKRTSSMGDERVDCETPSINPSMQSGWPGAITTKGNEGGSNQPFDFLGEDGLGLGMGNGEKKPSMPGTPVKKHAYGHSHGGGPFGHRVGHSSSQPSLGSDYDIHSGTLVESQKPNIPVAPRRATMQAPPTTKKPPPSTITVPHLTLTQTSSPDSPLGMDTDQSSPTVRIGPGLNAQSLGGVPQGRVGMLRRQSSGNGSSESEEERTPTKGGGERAALAPRPELHTPTPSPGKSRPPPSVINNPNSIMPRMSLPAFAAPKLHRTLHHRQSHPAPATNQPEEEDVFEKRFITLETLGKGAFSTVIKVQDRYGEGLYAVKKARGVFDGVKDRLRHLEEVDILRHLSKKPCSHVIKLEDAWEQNRQLFIQTELCLGSLAFFLEEYGRVVERLDEGRVWKIVRELSDGINHIHSSGVVHFDIKPANILISATGSLKIGDFGLATRYPRVSPAEILKGSGLGGVVPPEAKSERLEREGDRLYMPPEMLRGVFVMAADIYSFGLVILEVSTNICVPDGGAPWQALRTNDFSVVDLSPLSPALTDLVISCMNADPAGRPTAGNIVHHPVVQRARSGKDALAPEDPRWLVEVLSGSMSTRMRAGADGDVEMSD